MKDLPIGVFDSGLGGLTVVRELMRILPNEDIVYLGDTARVPYGNRSGEIINKFALEDANFLLHKKVKCIVIACNTVSAVSGDILKKKIKIPVFDVISPALSEAKKMKGKVGVIGTMATISTGAYSVDYSQACPLLVPFIEAGEIKSDALKIIIKDYLKPIKSNKISTLILGCTHYPIIENLIQKEMGKNVLLINPEKIVVKEVENFLTKYRMLNSQTKRGKSYYFVTDLTAGFSNVAEIFLGQSIKNNIKLISLI